MTNTKLLFCVYWQHRQWSQGYEFFERCNY